MLCQQAKQERKDEAEKRSKLVTMTWQGDRDSPEIISLPIPYELPPKPYSAEGVFLHSFSNKYHSFLSQVINVFTGIVIFRCAMVMGPRLLEERCVWTSLAKIVDDSFSSYN